MVQGKLRFEEGSYEGEVGSGKLPEGAGVFNYRGDDEDGRLCYDGEWKNKAAEGYGVMKWQNGDRWDTHRLSYQIKIRFSGNAFGDFFDDVFRWKNQPRVLNNKEN